MSNYIDISSFNPETIDYSKYLPWSEEGDGISRIALRVDQGTGTPDSAFLAHYEAAKKAGVQKYVFYHFCYPWLNADPLSEVNAFLQNLNNRLTADDEFMGDFEDFRGHVGAASWYVAFMQEMEQHFPTDQLTIYSYTGYIQQALQDARLARYGLVYSPIPRPTGPNARPPAPAPWSSYVALQWSVSDSQVPGVPYPVDADVLVAVSADEKAAMLAKLAEAEQDIAAAEEFFTAH